MKSVLIVDDEAKIREVVDSYLQKEGYQTILAQTGEECITLLQQESIDLVILDLMLPDISGEEVCEKIRSFSPVPILMLTAKVSEHDKVKGLSIGADDYVVKPFSPKELVARVKAIIRRSSENQLLADRISFHNGDLIIDTVQKKVSKSGQFKTLTKHEYQLLLTLARYPNRVFSREELIEKTFGFEYDGDLRSIDQHIKNLRKKIEDDPKNPSYILTVYGMGYKFMNGGEL